jgi:hypothetical protein
MEAFLPLLAALAAGILAFLGLRHRYGTACLS